MIYTLLADTLVLLHFAFIILVVIGGLAVLRWPRLIWLHLPAALWGAVIEFQGWICPLTPLEQQLRTLAGERAYSGDFIDHYILALIYPDGLTRETQLVLGLIVVLINGLIYMAIWRRRKRAAAAEVAVGQRRS